MMTTMKYPSELHYFESQSKEVFSRTPNGMLHIDKLIEGKPCWLSPALPRIEKPKSLVLADWTAAYWSPKKYSR